MTPAVTANALMRFAKVETSISAWIGHAPEKKTRAAWNMLDRIEEWAIDFHFDRGRALYTGTSSHHRHGRGRGCLRSFLIDRDKGFVKDLRDIKIIVRLPRRHPVEVGAAPRVVE